MRHWCAQIWAASVRHMESVKATNATSCSEKVMLFVNVTYGIKQLLYCIV